MNGCAESGKGTVITFIKQSFPIFVMEYSSIDYVKVVATNSFGWDGIKNIKGRNLLAEIKQSMIAYNDMPTKKVIMHMEEAIITSQDLFVVDIREPDEIEKLVNHCAKVEISCITCRVYNTKAELFASKNGFNLTGDRLYGQYDYDVNIYNNGDLSDLEKNVLEIFQDVL